MSIRRYPLQQAQNPRPLGRGFLTTLAILTLLGACSAPAEKFDHTAASLGLRRDVVMGTAFRHVLFWRDGGPNRTLHVYLGGDGAPLSAGQATEDPTPRNPLMLRLLALDPGPAVYVGRPCYHGLSQTQGCTGELWTTARYSEGVVVSLAAIIRRITASRGYERISLFGYSGGGTLAMLLAERLPETEAVVTIAANLDTDAWAEHHGYASLAGSLNPARRPPLPDRVVQRHYFGGRDRVVPPALLQSAAPRLGAEVTVIEAFDHVCCWEERWPRILARAAASE